MSDLDRFVRIRRFRAQAADNYALAAESFRDSVRARYLAIADHYTALADAELLSDQRERKGRLAEMQAKRAAARARRVPGAAPQPVTAAGAAAPAVPVRKLRLIQGDGAAAADKHRIIVAARPNRMVAGGSARRER
ncbi:MAG TPA: hypothetical protein VL048_11580 [Xanthobacteraceae bacterium]|nr:hypothetical protein [Xanthobacteraceae bacterium]